MAILFEVLEGIRSGFELSDSLSTGMLIVGGTLVVAAGVFETYFAVKTAEALEAKAEAIESRVKIELEKAERARNESASLLSRLAGKSKKTTGGG